MRVEIALESRRFRARPGVAVVEFALVSTLVVLLLLGVLEVGRLVQVTQILDNAAREGARQAFSGQKTYDDVSTTVTNYLKNAGVTNLTGLQIQVFNVTKSDHGPQKHGTLDDYDPSQATGLEQLQISVSLPYNNVRWINFGLVTNNNTRLSAQVLWNSVKNQSYPSSITAPLGF